MQDRENPPCALQHKCSSLSFKFSGQTDTLTETSSWLTHPSWSSKARHYCRKWMSWMIWPPAWTEAVAESFPPFLGSKEKHLYHQGTTISITINRKQVRYPFAYFLALDLPIFPFFGNSSFNLPKLREWLRWRMTLAMVIAFSVDPKISFICIMARIGS